MIEMVLVAATMGQVSFYDDKKPVSFMPAPKPAVSFIVPKDEMVIERSFTSPPIKLYKSKEDSTELKKNIPLGFIDIKPKEKEVEVSAKVLELDEQLAKIEQDKETGLITASKAAFLRRQALGKAVVPGAKPETMTEETKTKAAQQNTTRSTRSCQQNRMRWFRRGRLFGGRG